MTRIDANADACCTAPEGETPLVGNIFRLHHLMMRIGDRLTAPIGLTSSRWMLLCPLGRAVEPPRVSDLSEQAMLSPQNVSRMLQSLEAEGLVERYSTPGGGRAVYVRLTEKGQAAFEETKKLAEEFREIFLDGFDDERIARLSGDLEALIGNLRDHEGGAAERAHLQTGDGA